jgi:glucosamine--fructose-6-phosphate aminotransferase (isomerizing)
MCGITGYIGNENAMERVIYGLKRLEYRGYDSAGIAVIEDGKIIRCRTKGRVENLIEKIKDRKIKGTTGIGHTRWATHGKPSDENAHPHTDCTGRISIVHNGIIENYFELKEKLKKNHKFSSETDTEVFAHLIENFIHEGLENAVKKALTKIKGMYSLVIISSDEPDKIIAARQGSPLVIGVGKREYFVSSDVPSFLKYTNKAIFLEDGDVAVITKESIKIFNNDKIVRRKIKQIQWTDKQAEKAGYPHFMLKEIMEEPQAFEDTIIDKFDEKYGNVKFENVDFNKLKNVENVRIIACGTSYHAAFLAKYLFEKWAGINTQVEIGSEIRYANPILGSKTLVIVISQSGETIDTIEAFKNIKKSAYYSIAIVNVVGSTLSRMLHGVIYTHAGPEIGVAATKTFISQLAVLYLLALSIAKVRRKFSTKDVKNALRALRKIPMLIREIFNDTKSIEKVADKYYVKKDFLYYGRNVNYPIALEGALKLKEISYIHAEGYPAGEMKHGPIALVDDRVPNVFIAPENNLYEKITNNIEEIKARNGIIILVTNKSNKKAGKIADDVIYVPDMTEDFYPLLTIIPLQLLAYYIGVKKGIDVDKPRNLAKSVTVE